MSETKFTNGKWVAFYPHELLNDGHISVETESGKLIYFREVHKTTLEEQAANANLIAAAPDMYEFIDGLYEATCLNGGLIQLDGHDCEEMKRLLAKARGES